MKISVDVETESHSFDHKETPQRGNKGGLKWRIDVSLGEAAPSPGLAVISEASESVTRAPASVVTRPGRVSRVDLTSSGAQTAIRKLSSTSELIERMGRGRKVIAGRCRIQLTFSSQVSRQGEWLVFTEKYGLLTTQNGTQQVG